LLRERLYPIGVAAMRPKVHPHVAVFDPTQVRKRLLERRGLTFLLRIVFVEPHKHADAPHAVALLRARHERRSDRRAAEQRDELAPSHSMTSSARSRIEGGTARPSALAVLRLTTN